MGESWADRPCRMLLPELFAQELENNVNLVLLRNLVTMGNYITKSLEDGEQIVFQGHLHWTAIYQYILSALLMLLIAIGLMVAGYLKSQQELYIVGIVFIVISIVLYITGWIVRTKCEFAVTNNRFVQKDGILNIRMTEIPLFKIETVNFYRSFGQRILGTGSIELVGSGGTTHKVENVEDPLKVRKMILTALTKNGKGEE